MNFVCLPTTHCIVRAIVVVVLLFCLRSYYRARSRRGLIQYTIQTSEDLIERMMAAERESAGSLKRYSTFFSVLCTGCLSDL